MSEDATAANGGVEVIIPVEYRQFPCEAGTYNPNEAATSEADCIPCIAGKACEKKGITDTTEMSDCAAGYYCLSGANTRYPDGSSGSAGPCPAGHYCIAGTSVAEPCPEGTWSNQEKATDVEFCMPCPPGYICTGTGNT